MKIAILVLLAIVLTNVLTRNVKNHSRVGNIPLKGGCAHDKNGCVAGATCDFRNDSQIPLRCLIPLYENGCVSNDQCARYDEKNDGKCALGMCVKENFKFPEPKKLG